MDPVLVIKHVESEGPGLLGEFLQARGLALSVVELEKGEGLPDRPEGFSAVISMGGPMGVYDEEDYPFLRKELPLLQAVIERDIPFIGVCLGAQMLARAGNARVLSKACTEIGFYPIRLTKEGQEDPLFAGVPEEFVVFQWHNDVFEIPEGAVWLAESAKCPNQAFRLGGRVYALQFHVEATPEMVEDWFSEDLESSDPTARARAEEMIRMAPKVVEANRATYDRIFENFLSILRG